MMEFAALMLGLAACFFIGAVAMAISLEVKR